MSIDPHSTRQLAGLLWIAAARGHVMLSPYAMTSYRITVHDDGEPAEGVERHASMEVARRSAVRSAVGIFMDTRELDGPMTATVTVRDEKTQVAHIVRVSLLVSYTVERR